MSRLSHEYPDNPSMWHAPYSSKPRNIKALLADITWDVVDGSTGDVIDVADTMLDALTLVERFYKGYVDVYVRETAS